MTAKAEGYSPQTRLCLVGYDSGATSCSFTLAKSNWGRIRQIMALNGKRPIRLVKPVVVRTTPASEVASTTDGHAIAQRAERLRRLRILRLRRLRLQRLRGGHTISPRVTTTTTVATTTTTTTTRAPTTTRERESTTSWYDSWFPVDNWSENPFDSIDFNSVPTQEYHFEYTID